MTHSSPQIKAFSTLIAGVFIAFIPFATLGQGPIRPNEKEVLAQLEGFNKMRESLASSLDGTKAPITVETFQKVCAPVGKALKNWSETHKIQARQISRKNRNPLNALQAEDEKSYLAFEQDAQLKHLTVPGVREGKSGKQIYYRIPVTQACLHCHGPKDARPEFIKAKYPKDKAHGFLAGELRGLYSVFIFD